MKIYHSNDLYIFNSVNKRDCVREEQRLIVYVHVSVGYIHVNKRVSNKIMF